MLIMKSKRFAPIHEIASISARDSGRAMDEAARKVTDLERQLQQLQSYREEYVRGSMQSGGAIDAVKLQNYRSFLDRLGEALRQHEKNLEAARAEYDRRRSVWSEKRVEAESLGRVVQRFQKEERRVQDAREQRDGDEIAMRLALLNRAESGADTSGSEVFDTGDSGTK
jgi:flagellar export protein FliJ